MGALAVGVTPRGISHGLVVVLALIAALLSTASLSVVRATPISLEARAWEFRSPSLSPLSLRSGQSLRNLQLPTVVEPVQDTGTKQRTTIVEYRIQPGDTVSTIAQRFGITTATLVQANDLSNEDRVVVGDELAVPPVSGTMHKVKKGDTLLSIAFLYRAQVDDILAYGPNGVSDADQLQIGKTLIIPGGAAPPKVVAIAVPAARPVQPQAPPQAAAPAAPPQPVRRGTGQFSWPTTGPIFQYFSGYHPGIDISPPFGTPIYAADAGRVIQIQQLSWGYGWHLYVDHGNGYVTQYAHVSSFAVSVGDYVSRGQFIARVGSTGNSSGPHLHFEIRYNGVAQNPLGILP